MTFAQLLEQEPPADVAVRVGSMEAKWEGGRWVVYESSRPHGLYKLQHSTHLSEDAAVDVMLKEL